MKDKYFFTSFDKHFKLNNLLVLNWWILRYRVKTLEMFKGDLPKYDNNNYVHCWCPTMNFKKPLAGDNLLSYLNIYRSNNKLVDKSILWFGCKQFWVCFGLYDLYGLILFLWQNKQLQ